MIKIGPANFTCFRKINDQWVSAILKLTLVHHCDACKYIITLQPCSLILCTKKTLEEGWRLSGFLNYIPVTYRLLVTSGGCCVI